MADLVTDEADVTALKAFEEFGVDEPICTALLAAGITRAFAIQEYALPIALRGTDLIGQAPTGTGKTLGFGVPLLERVPRPTEGADGLAPGAGRRAHPRAGPAGRPGHRGRRQTRGVRVLPSTAASRTSRRSRRSRASRSWSARPAGCSTWPSRSSCELGRVRALVLDEADRMLDLGFLDDVEKILAMLPEERQTMLFSATMPDPIVTLARRFLRQPVTIHAEHHDERAPSPLTKQVVYRTHR